MGSMAPQPKIAFAKALIYMRLWNTGSSLEEFSFHKILNVTENAQRFLNSRCKYKNDAESRTPVVTKKVFSFIKNL